MELKPISIEYLNESISNIYKNRFNINNDYCDYGDYDDKNNNSRNINNISSKNR